MSSSLKNVNPVNQGAHTENANEGHYFPVNLTDEDGNDVIAVNTDNLIVYMNGTNELFQETLEIYHRSLEIFENAVSKKQKDEAFKFVKGLKAQFQSLLNDYEKQTKLCEGLFETINTAVDSQEQEESNNQ